MTFVEFVELRVMPPASADAAFRQAAEMESCGVGTAHPTLTGLTSQCDLPSDSLSGQSRFAGRKKVTP